jgi:hypothetical protein
MGARTPVMPPPKLNLDRFGMPKDYPTYIWLLYGERVEDKSPQRLAFTNRPLIGEALFFSLQYDEI